MSRPAAGATRLSPLRNADITTARHIETPALKLAAGEEKKH